MTIQVSATVRVETADGDLHLSLDLPEISTGNPRFVAAEAEQGLLDLTFKIKRQLESVYGVLPEGAVGLRKRSA